MALEGVVSTVAGEILKLLGSQALECFGLMWGLNDDLDDFKSKVSSIQAVLRDAEERQIKGDRSVSDWLEKLGDVLYDMEDVLDEISIEPSRRNVMTKGKNAKQVRIFFSNSNQLAFNYRIARQVKNIRARLDRISKEKLDFNFKENAVTTIQNVILSHPTKTNRETDSSLSMEKVIGRDDDMSNLRNLLLTPDMNVKANVSFIAIVGMGGIGKTTLAKALYNDTQVEDCFSPRIWIWVSDQFDTNTILEKIIESATTKKPQVEGREALKTEVQKVIEEKKYLLVMDDVWNEDENEWENLKNLLMVGARGSKILITKRDSREVAKMKTVILKDLPENPSWLLFKEVAFKESDSESTNSELIQLGKEISKKCGGIPLVIRHIGRLLYGKTEKAEWVSVMDNKLLNVTRGQNNNDGHVILSLKLSYNHLPPNLKQCFAYTSLFFIGLQNLQTLNLTPDFGDLKEYLPRDICNLENLRHLVFYCVVKPFDMPEGWKKLSYLQTLSSFMFDCKKFNKVREEFNELHCFIGVLRITGLEQLRSTPSELNLLNLKNKKGIQFFILEWELGKDKYEGEVDETILECLEPHPDVKILGINGYCGVGLLPNWLSTSRLKYLIGIEIENCHRLQHLNQLCYLLRLSKFYV